jgi:hypothetical protein
VPKAFELFDAEGRMKPSSYRDRVVDVMEELFRFTLLRFTCERSADRDHAESTATWLRAPHAASLPERVRN